jgi:hypothetical protein
MPMRVAENDRRNLFVAGADGNLTQNIKNRAGPVSVQALGGPFQLLGSAIERSTGCGYSMHIDCTHFAALQRRYSPTNGGRALPQVPGCCFFLRFSGGGHAIFQHNLNE